LHVVDLSKQFPQTTLKGRRFYLLKVQQFTEMVAQAAVKRKRSFILVIAISCTKGRTPFAPVNVAAAGHSIAYSIKRWAACLERVARFRPNFSVLPKVRSLCWDFLKE